MSSVISCSKSEDNTKRRLPDFVIIGAAKSGTTTLHRYLMQFEQIFVPIQKELEFFVRNSRTRGLDWYSSQFADATNSQLCGEASPSYSFYPQFLETSRRMHEVIPDAKIIYIVRHPVDRAFSHYYQRVKSARHLAQRSKDRFQQWTIEEIELCQMIQAAEQRGGLARGASFEDVIEKANWIIEAGRYHSQLEQYLRYFDRDKILVLFFEDLVNNRTRMLARLLKFLGADPAEATKAATVKANTSAEHSRVIACDHIIASLRSIPGATSIGNLLPKRVRHLLYSSMEATTYGKDVRRKYDPPPMLAETRQRLLADYRDSNQWLQEFTGRDLNHWNK